MAKPKKTQWFDGRVKPARVGVYQRQGHSMMYFSMWDGHIWRMSMRSPDAAAMVTRPSFDQHRPWRGLAEQPKEQKK